MSATTDLRRLLDERGIEYETCDDTHFYVPATFWVDHNGDRCSALECVEVTKGGGTLDVCMVMTPEQAIDATLGAGTCHIKPWKMERDTGFYDCMECECGYVSDVSDWAKWHFCPNCRRVIR